MKNGDTCLPKDYCAERPCFGNATCDNKCQSPSVASPAICNIPADEQPYKCTCPGSWYGPICQCHPELNPGGAACLIVYPPDPVVSSATGMIVGILLGIIVLIGKNLLVNHYCDRLIQDTFYSSSFCCLKSKKFFAIILIC